jgi:hypothetical protein
MLCKSICHTAGATRAVVERAGEQEDAGSLRGHVGPASRVGPVRQVAARPAAELRQDRRCGHVRILEAVTSAYWRITLVVVVGFRATR